MSFPTLAQGIARGPGEAKYPQLWNNLTFCCAMSAGVTGLTMHDYSSFNLTGTLAGSLTGADWVIDGTGFTGTTKPVSYSMFMDRGADDHINWGTSSSLKMNLDNFAITAWTKIQSSPVNRYHPFLANGAESNGDAGYLFAFDSTSNAFRCSMGDATDRTSYYAGSGLVLDDDTWHHVAVNYDRTGNMECFIDGDAIGSTNISSRAGETIGAVGDNTYMGRWTSIGFTLDDWLGDVMAWRRLLTRIEIKRMALDPSFSPLNLVRKTNGFVAAAVAARRIFVIS